MNHVWQLMASFAPRLKSQIGQSVDCSSLSNPLRILRCSMLQSVSNHLQDERKTGLACESRSMSSAIVECPFVQSQLTLRHKFDLNLCSEVTHFLPLFMCLMSSESAFVLTQGHCGTFLPLSSFLDPGLPRKICFYIESYRSKQLSAISFHSPTGSSIF